MESMEEMVARHRADPTFHGLGDGYQKFMDDHGIKPERITPEEYSCRIGWSEKEQKWYGWSHRAIYGFGVGSVCKKGDVGYTANNVDELADDHVAFMADVETPEEQEARRKRITKNYPLKCIHIGSHKLAIPIVHSVAGLQAEFAAPGTMGMGEIELGGQTVHCGKGEWTANTLDDAKQMAIDFADAIA
jgi:hypothetical protein